MAAQRKQQDVTAQVPAVKEKGPKLITSKEMIMQEYPDVFQGIGKFPGPDYHIQLDPSIPPKHTPCQPIPIHLKDLFQQEINKMLQAGILVLVHEATPWINSFVIVEIRDKLGNLKLHICLDPTNLNKAIMREPFHFRMTEDIAHLLADACVMTVYDCKKGYWHQKLDEASSYLTTFNMELGRYMYTVIPFGITVAGDVFQRKLDQYFGQIEQVIVIADDIMIVGNQPNHRDHDVVLTNLLETARKSNIHLNFDKLAYKQTEVDSLGKPIPWMDASQLKARYQQYQRCLHQQVKSRYNLLLVWLTTYLSFWPDCQNLLNLLENYVKIKYLSTGDQNTKLHSSKLIVKLLEPPY